MRIISGTFGGRKLIAPAGNSTRPTTDLVRGAVFNMLASRITLDEFHSLDLFAGSGAYGLEALSRGAISSTFVESSAKAAAVIERNIEALALQAQAHVVVAKVENWLGGWQPLGPTVVFADPPYGEADWAALGDLLSGKVEWIVAEDGSPIGEEGQVLGKFTVISARRHGQSAVTLLRADS